MTTCMTLHLRLRSVVTRLCSWLVGTTTAMAEESNLQKQKQTTSLSSKEKISCRMLKSQLPFPDIEEKLKPFTKTEEIRPYHSKLKLNKQQSKIKPTKQWLLLCATKTDTTDCTKRQDPKQFVRLAPDFKPHVTKMHPEIEENDTYQVKIWGRLDVNETKNMYTKYYKYVEPKIDENNNFLGYYYIDPASLETSNEDDSNNDENDPNDDQKEANSNANLQSHENNDLVEHLNENMIGNLNLDDDLRNDLDNENEMKEDSDLDIINVNEAEVNESKSNAIESSGLQSNVNEISSLLGNALLEIKNEMSEIKNAMNLNEMQWEIKNICDEEIKYQNPIFCCYQSLNDFNESFDDCSFGITRLEGQEAASDPLKNPMFAGLERTQPVPTDAADFTNPRHKELKIVSKTMYDFIRCEGKGKFTIKKKYGKDYYLMTCKACKYCHKKHGFMSNCVEIENFTFGIKITKQQLRSIEFFSGKKKGILKHLLKVISHFNNETLYLIKKLEDSYGIYLRGDIFLHLIQYPGSMDRFADILGLFLNNKHRSGCKCKHCCAVGHKSHSRRIVRRFSDITDCYLNIQLRSSVLDTKIIICNQTIVLISMSTDGVDFGMFLFLFIVFVFVLFFFWCDLRSFCFVSFRFHKMCPFCVHFCVCCFCVQVPTSLVFMV